MLVLIVDFRYKETACLSTKVICPCEKASPSTDYDLVDFVRVVPTSDGKIGVCT